MSRLQQLPRISTALDIERLNESLEAAHLLTSSEAGFARDYHLGVGLGFEPNGCRLAAFSLGILDGLADTLDPAAELLPLLVYLNSLLQHGPGRTARDATLGMLQLTDQPELVRYVAGGRRLVLRMLAGRAMSPGLFASLLEEELQNP